MFDFEFVLFDRLEMIKLIDIQYDLRSNSYISFSGGKDSTVLHYLIDMALPNNRIPRVFINTGIEYIDIVKFVKELAAKDDRFIILPPKQSIKNVLETYGYPFKSKIHSHHLSIYQNSGFSLSVNKYLGIEKGNFIHSCPNILRYQFSPDFKIKCSDKCCYKLKKEPLSKWQKENNKIIVLTGMRKDEFGQRANLNGCILFDKKNNVVKFHPLLVVSEDFENEFIKRNNISLCKLYYSPFYFKRTGCKGCPFTLDLQQQLDIMDLYLPNEKKQCEIIWKPIYEEYRRLGYRLKNNKQLSFDYFL